MPSNCCFLLPLLFWCCLSLNAQSAHKIVLRLSRNAKLLLFRSFSLPSQIAHYKRICIMLLNGNRFNFMWIQMRFFLLFSIIFYCIEKMRHGNHTLRCKVPFNTMFCRYIAKWRYSLKALSAFKIRNFATLFFIIVVGVDVGLEGQWKMCQCLISWSKCYCSRIRLIS